MEIQQLARQAFGDDAAFQQLIEILTPRMQAIARSYVDGEADDVVQEVWMKFMKFREIMDPPDNFAAYIAQAVRHSCIDWLRKRDSRTRLSQDHRLREGLMDGYEDPEELTLSREQAAALDACVVMLPELYGLPIRLYYREEMPVQEIAALLGVSVAAVKWRLYTGRQMLKKYLITGGHYHDA